jgi:hypothetical protein
MGNICKVIELWFLEDSETRELQRAQVFTEKHFIGGFLKICVLLQLL